MTLPAIYYDFISEVRPFVLELAERDEQDLLRNPEELSFLLWESNKVLNSTLKDF